MNVLLEIPVAPTKAAGDCCSGCVCSSCSSAETRKASAYSGEEGGGDIRPIPPTRPVPFDRTKVEHIMGFQFEPLVHRMVDKYQWSEPEAQEIFQDLKRFLALTACSLDTVVPSPKIDEIWHNFMLFSEDYEEFCREHIGRFIHHRPRRRTEAITTRTGKDPIESTLKLARSIFGDLSEHWTYPMYKEGLFAHTCDNPHDPSSRSDCTNCSDCAPVACGHR